MLRTYGKNFNLLDVLLMRLLQINDLNKSKKRLALEWINKDNVGESSVDKNGNVNVNEEQRVKVDEVNVNLNVNEEQIVNLDEVNVKLNVDDYTIYDNYKFNVQDNYDINDYPIDENEYVNVDENVNVDEFVNVDENINVYENMNDSLEDEQGRGDDREDSIVYEEHVIDEVEVNMKGFTFSVGEQGADPTVTHNVDLTNKALEVSGNLSNACGYVGKETSKSMLKGGNYKELLWKCATTIIVVAFERTMDEFKGANCDLLINTICEVFNRQLLEARDSLVITALEYVREYLMKRIVIVQKVNDGRQNQVVVDLAKELLLVTAKEDVKDQVLLVVELKVYHKHQGKGKHLQVDLQVAPNQQGYPKDLQVSPNNKGKPKDLQVKLQVPPKQVDKPKVLQGPLNQPGKPKDKVVLQLPEVFWRMENEANLVKKLYVIDAWAWDAFKTGTFKLMVMWRQLVVFEAATFNSDQQLCELHLCCYDHISRRLYPILQPAANVIIAAKVKLTKLLIAVEGDLVFSIFLKLEEIAKSRPKPGLRHLMLSGCGDPSWLIAYAEIEKRAGVEKGLSMADPKPTRTEKPDRPDTNQTEPKDSRSGLGPGFWTISVFGPVRFWTDAHPYVLVYGASSASEGLSQVLVLSENVDELPEVGGTQYAQALNPDLKASSVSSRWGKPKS
nr:hypothetical protein [Tanacetum cinerariifolium]